MENKQSSVQWLINQIIKHNRVNSTTLQQANEMHQKEIIKASARGYVIASDGFPLQEAINYAQQYYKETFNK